MATDKRESAISLTVPQGEVFVLGDNRSNSKDTRNFGPVPLQDIVGKAQQVWFSRTAQDGVRWDRLGKMFD
jgi:signal peptidase I